MNLSTRLKMGTVFFTVIWSAGQIWLRGDIIMTAMCGPAVGYAWYRVMRWQLARGRLPRRLKAR
jgi:hypothetical protein